MSALNYHHLRYFWAVAHDGNLTRTAERLHLTQSGLSVQIRKLEAALGHTLFERRNRQLHLTEAGRLVLDHADRIFEHGKELMDTLKSAQQQRQILRVGALATLSRNFQMDFLQPLLDREDVELILRAGGTHELFDALFNLNLDVVLINQAPGRETLRSLIYHKIADQPVSLIACPQQIRNHSQSKDLTKLLSQYPLILPTEESGIRIAFDALADRLGVSPQLAAEVDDMAMMRLLARANRGLAILPPIAVKDELAAGTLIELAQLPGIAEHFYAVTNQRRFANPLIRELIPP